MSYDFDSWSPEFRVWHQVNQRSRAEWTSDGRFRFSGPTRKLTHRPRRRRKQVTADYRKFMHAHGIFD